MDINKILSGIIQLAIVLFSLSVHESAHAWMADKCGDPTAKYQGRITLNPIAHIDLFGTIIFPIILAIIGGPVFGWAKPVQVNPYNFRHYKRDNMLVSGAGPASNIILAALGIFTFQVLKNAGIVNISSVFGYLSGGDTAGILSAVLFLLIIINIYLAIFNLIPVPPLDGSGIIEGMLHGEAYNSYQRIKPYGFIILIVIIYTNILDYIATPIISFVARLLI